MTMPDRRVRDALSTEANLLRDPIRSIHSERDNRLTPIKGLLAATGVAAVVLLLVGVPILVLRSGTSPNPPTVGAPTTSTTTHVPAASTTTDGSGEVVESSDGDQVGAANDVSPTSKQSLRDASTLRYEQTAGIYGNGLSLREDGSYSWRLTTADDEGECGAYYDPSTNIDWSGCTGEEAGERYVSGFILRNIPSTGEESLKWLGFINGGVGAYAGASHLPLEESPDGIRSIPLITRSEVIDGHDLSLDGFDGTEAEFEEAKARELDSLVLDIQTGLVIEAVSVGGDLLLSAGALVVADEDREHQANIEWVESLIAQAATEDITEEDRGYQQLVSLDDAQEAVSYQVPVVTLPDTFELSEVFYGPRSTSHSTSWGADVVIQVYRDGLREIVVTSSSDEFDSDGDPNETRDEYQERAWYTSPLDHYPVGYPLEESGWSALIQHPALPPHFWGISNGAVVTVEGWLVSPAVLENVRQQVTTHSTATASTTTDGSGGVVESSDGDQVKAADGVGPTSKQSLRDASTLRYEQTAGTYGKGVVLGEDGSYSWQSANTDSGTGCTAHYDPSTNIEWKGCTDEEAGERYVSASLVRNLPSTGVESLKWKGFSIGDIGTFAGASQLPLEESPDGIRQIPLITRSEVIDGDDLDGDDLHLDEYDGSETEVDASESLGSLAVDIQTGLVVEAASVGGDLIASAGALVLADEDREHQANIERVKSLIDQVDPNDIREGDRGYQQLVSLDDAQELVSYQVPVIALPDTFELSEVFYGPRSTAPFTSMGADVVIQVYRDGLREIVVTSGSDGFDRSGDSNETREDYLEPQWDTSPFDFWELGYPLEESGWSALVQYWDLPPHFWGISNGAVVTVEGWLVSPAVLENVRQQVITNPE